MRTTEHGFTLIEMTIAIAISVILVGGIYQALVSARATSASLAADAGKEASRMRVIEVLKGDLRSRLGLKVTAAPQGGVMLSLSSTSDSLALGEIRRMLPSLRYVASEQGLKREEGEGSELVLATGPVGFEFWEKGAWRKVSFGDPVALRVIFSEPDDVVVIR